MEFDGKLYQIGVVVRDLEASMEHYRTLFGLGPFRRLDTDYTGRYRGTEQRIANRNAFARWGDLYLEMVEPGSGQSSASEWLQTRGEGIFHLGYATTNLDQRPGGAQVCFETIDNLNSQGQPAIIHLDTVTQLGYFVELADAQLAERLAQWIDGGADLTG
ncbi:VOC family protein [Pseudomonas sp. TYF_14]|uniref:VOC family protein n=1 Tax=Pseudomonas sp. TYF_14 TaxID=3367193 RepID=UPI00370C7D13